MGLLARAEDNLVDYDSMTIQELLALDESLTWVFAGDSITHNADYTSGMNSYADYFEQRLYELGRDGDAVINTAWGGATVKYYLPTNTTSGQGVDDFVTNYKPDVVFLKLGMNDRRSAASVEAFMADYRTVLDAIYAAGKEDGKIPKIILLSTTPRSSDTIYNKDQTNDDTCWPWANAVEELAEEYGLIFVDLMTAFVEEALVLGDDYHHTFFSAASDGATHPN